MDQPTEPKPKPAGKGGKGKRRSPPVEPEFRRYVALLDFDGLLCDMRPFQHELMGPRTHEQWRRFFSHTPQAVPVPAGIELANALYRLGWRYAVSTTRPAWNGGMVGRWVRRYLPGRVEWVYASGGEGRSPAEHKRDHYVEAMVARGPVCGLFVDDDAAVVDELIEFDVPAMHIDELAGLSDADLTELLRYSVKSADARRAELRAAARAAGVRANRDELLRTPRPRRADQATDLSGDEPGDSPG